MPTRFKFLIGDVNWQDYGGKFYRRVRRGAKKTGGCYHIMEISRWPESEEAETGRYHVELDEVDLDAATEAQLAESLRSFFGDEKSISDIEKDSAAALIKLDALHSYGHKAPLWQQSGNNYRELMAEARRESAALDDPQLHEERMSRPVNAIGSTAREFMQGDISSAMNRIREAPVTETKIGTLRVGCAFSVALHKIPSDDPLAYTMGYTHAIAGSGLPEECSRREIAPAYFEGYRLGTDVKSGRQDAPSWAKRTA